MQVYKNILVSMDCSPVDDAIIDHIIPLALQNSARVHLLHVVHSHTLDQDRALRRQAEAMLHEQRDKLRSRGIDVRILLKSGEPDEEILEEIQGSDYDLVAMATHGHSFIGDILFGSVSRTLKHKIDVPLLLLKGRR